jgi:hypothetical protein
MGVEIGISIQLDKERHYRLSLRAAKAFEAKTGKSMLKGFRFEDLTDDDWVVMIWAGLLDEDPNLTIDQVSTIVDIPMFTELCPIIIKAVIGDKKEKKQSDPLAQTSKESEKPTG